MLYAVQHRDFSYDRQFDFDATSSCRHSAWSAGMPPPVTPSPHRFVSGRQRKAVAQDEGTKPPSRMNRPDVDPDLRPSTVSSKQFSRKPPFAAAAAAAVRPADASGSQRPSLLQALKSSTQRREDVDEASSQSAADADELLTAEDSPDVLPSIELPHVGNVDPRPLKRSHDAGLEGPTNYPAFRHPQTPASHTKTPAVPKFTSGQVADPGESGNRPAFLRPSSSHTAESFEPLPEAFSPHRRGQKYLPGGAAAMVQQWVLEIGHEVTQKRRAYTSIRDEEFVLQARVDELHGEGPWTAMASVDGGSDLALLLPGDGSQVEGLRVGCTVVARTPTWEVELNGQKWTVIVDWKVID